jgi:flagellar basal-body rod protein FlgB
MLPLLNSVTKDAVSTALDGLQQRYMAIGANIANADTPNYQAVDVAFEHTLQAQIKAKTPGYQRSGMDLLAQSPGHFMDSQSVLGADSVMGNGVTPMPMQYQRNGNGVDMDKEMAYLAQTGQRFMALSQIQGKMYKSLRGVITSNG